MAINFIYNNLQFTYEIETWSESLPSRISSEQVPRRHGQYVTDEPVLGARVINLGGIVKASSWSTLQTDLEILSQKFGCGGTAWLYKYDSRRIAARKQDFSFSYVQGTGMLVAQFTVSMFCDDPFWYNPNLTSDTQNPSSSPHGWTHSNAGTSLIYPVVKITGAGAGTSNPKLTNSTAGWYVQYTGTVASGKQLVIDCANFTMVNDGTDVLNSFSGEFVYLDVGNNVMALTYSGANPTECKMEYYQRFI